MVVNPYGAVWATDFGNPVVISAYADSVISGGQLVLASGLTNLVSSGLDSFATTDITVRTGASGMQFLGVALATVASGALVPIAVRGVFLLPARIPVSGGYGIAAVGDDAIGFSLTAGHIMGKALTGATSGGYAVAFIQ